MNKARRHELKMLKFKKRIKNMSIPLQERNHWYRTTGKPCSCAACSRHRELPYRMKHSDKVKSQIGVLIPDNDNDIFEEPENMWALIDNGKPYFNDVPFDKYVLNR